MSLSLLNIHLNIKDIKLLTEFSMNYLVPREQYLNVENLLKLTTCAIGAHEQLSLMNRINQTVILTFAHYLL